MAIQREVAKWEKQDPQYEAFFQDANNRVLYELLEGEVPEIRNRLKIIGEAAPVPNTDDLDIESIEAGSFQVLLYRAKASESQSKLPVMLVYHGGGWICGNVYNEHNSSIAFARAGFAVANVEYRLAPEHVFPAAAEDAKASLDWVLKHADKYNFDTSNILVYGTSAGGNLAAITAQYARDKSIKLSGQLLRVPALCHPDAFPKDKYPYESSDSLKKGPILGQAELQYCLKTYFTTGDAKDPQLSPLLGKLDGLAPAYIEIAGRDPLRDEALAYAQELKNAGVPVEHTVFDGVPHAFSILPFDAGIEAEKAMVAHAKQMAGI